jgi:DNA-binding transcriptional MerR regulator
VARTAAEVPNKLFYKIGEVCEFTDTQPYVLRFWESEFPQLAPRKNRSGQRVYQRKDIEMVMRIKKLLYQEEYTIAGARKKLDEDPLAGGPVAVEGLEARTAPGASNGDEAPRGMTRPVEADHPVDVIASRAGRGAARRETARAGDGGDGDSRREKALAELKRSLREMQAILRKEP